MNLTETHKTVQNIKARGAFTVSIADAAHVTEADYFGVESGNREPDKFARSRLTATKSETVDAPIINNFPPRTKRQSDKLSLTAKYYLSDFIRYPSYSCGDSLGRFQR